MNYVRAMLNAAQEAGFEIQVGSGAEVDYKGFHPAAAEEAINAVDETEVILRDNGKVKGWAMIVNGLEPDERIADTAYPWMNDWCEANVS